MASMTLPALHFEYGSREVVLLELPRTPRRNDLPALIMMMFVAVLRFSRKCVVTRIVTLHRQLVDSSQNRRLMIGSTPLVGSSRKTIFGWCRTAQPRAASLPPAGERSRG